MHNVNDAGDSEAVAVRRQRLGEWIGQQIQDNDLNRTALAEALGVPVDLVVAREAGLAELTLDQAASLDHAFGLPAGSTGAAGGYFGFLATPCLDGEEVFDSREYTRTPEMLDDLAAAVKLGLGIRLSNRWEPVEVDQVAQSCVSEQRWVLDLLTNPPSIDPFC